jgi:putative addiction module component (TIGR02574 family)
MSKVSLSDLLELPVAERLRVVQAVWDSIAEASESLPLSDEDRRELDRRLDAYYRNPDAGSPWPEVKARILGRR